MSDVTVQKQVILPRRPIKQQTPCIFPGGDCGALVVGGLLGGHDAGWTVERVYDELHQAGEYYGGKPVEKRSSFCRQSMVRTLDLLASDTGCRGGCNDIPVLLDHVISDVPVWLDSDYGRDVPFGLRAQFAWREYCRAMLNAGYYGIAQVKHGGYPEDAPIRTWGTTDHWVMICGWRYIHSLEGESEERKKAGLGHYEGHVLIGDSSRSRPLETWVELNEFTNRWGGYSAIWARPFPVSAIFHA
jgi:hypothetical protein